ncbi:hypothetical protein HZU75_08685 [Chitinibacter fontanus]|uniref:Uncharacterized protein n=1 Tax=Chitinibacter fontanus TaxID=1737446 RepID=A0A7D5Z3H9_9NEIS|nr:hypothetical protein [Chitinibacter fontanus]QLI81601.1 hypothetical protein HZU75_08685 [Chitinibacter fontanus]
MIHCVQHGEFQYKWQHNVLVVTYTGSWNVQAVHALHQTVAANWQARPEQRWAMLTDASHWEGGTQKCSMHGGYFLKMQSRTVCAP